MYLQFSWDEGHGTLMPRLDGVLFQISDLMDGQRSSAGTSKLFVPHQIINLFANNPSTDSFRPGRGLSHIVFA